jgi:NUDIX domain-containing protein
MSKPVKQSVSIAVFDVEGHVLVVQRPEDDEDLPNAWGLPASSLRQGETFEDAVVRTGREKLGVTLRPIAELQRGSIERGRYTLEMRLYSASIVAGTIRVPQPVRGVTQYADWRWGSGDTLLPAAQAGSLCCRLYLDWEGSRC